MTILDTEKVLIPNWFEKEYLEELLNERISDNLFKKITIWYNDKTITLANDTSGIIREFLMNDIEEIKGSVQID